MPALFWLCLAWLGGLALAWLPEPRLALLWLGGACLLALLHRDRLAGQGTLATLALAIALLGCWRGLPPTTTTPAALPDAVRVVRGVVVSWPQAREQALLAHLQVSEAAVGDRWQPLDATVEVMLPLTPEVDLGDRIEAVGRLRPLAEIQSAQSRERLREQGLSGQVIARRHVVLGQAMERSHAGWRDATAAAVTRALDRHLPARIAALAAGVLIGERQALPPDLRAAFTATGTAHLLVVSGWNMTLVVAFMAWIGASLHMRHRRVWVPVTLISLAAYTALVGGDPAVARAGLMGGLGVLALATGRRADPLLTLVVAAAVMTGLQPSLLVDLGFQLSFLATLGLLVALQPLRPRLAMAPWLARALVVSLATTVAAQIAVEPLLAYTFGRVSLIAPVTNLLVEPWAPLVMAGALGVAVFALLGLSWLADLAGWLTVVAATPLLWAVETSARLPFASIAVPPPTASGVSAIYVALLAFAALLLAPHPGATLGRVAALGRVHASTLGLIALVMAATTIWTALLLA